MRAGPWLVSQGGRMLIISPVPKRNGVVLPGAVGRAGIVAQVQVTDFGTRPGLASDLRNFVDGIQQEFVVVAYGWRSSRRSHPRPSLAG